MCLNDFALNAAEICAFEIFCYWYMKYTVI